MQLHVHTDICRLASGFSAANVKLVLQSARLQLQMCVHSRKPPLCSNSCSCSSGILTATASHNYSTSRFMVQRLCSPIHPKSTALVKVNTVIHDNKNKSTLITTLATLLGCNYSNKNSKSCHYQH